MAHRFERLVDKLAKAIEVRSDAMARAITPKGSQQPFTHKLSKQEQLEQYFAMDEQKWAMMADKHGIKGVRDYSAAMLKLYKEVYGEPPQGVVTIASGEPFRQPPELPLEVQAQAAVAEQNQMTQAPGMAPQGPQGAPPQPPPAPMPPVPTADQIVQQALANAQGSQG